MTYLRLWRLPALVLLAAALLAAAPTVVRAQADTGVIDGRVFDESKAAMPGVTVTAKNAATGFARSAVSGATGTYRIGLEVWDDRGQKSANTDVITVNIYP